jgi:hypothetical protein
LKAPIAWHCPDPIPVNLSMITALAVIVTAAESPLRHTIFGVFFKNTENFCGQDDFAEKGEAFFPFGCLAIAVRKIRDRAINLVNQDRCFGRDPCRDIDVPFGSIDLCHVAYSEMPRFLDLYAKAATRRV